MTYSVAFWTGQERISIGDMSSVAACYDAMQGRVQLWDHAGKLIRDAFTIYEGDFDRIIATPKAR